MTKSSTPRGPSAQLASATTPTWTPIPFTAVTLHSDRPIFCISAFVLLEVWNLYVKNREEKEDLLRGIIIGTGLASPLPVLEKAGQRISLSIFSS
ncbi:hypothetical protein SUGI_1062070 [Cryptomeria japonica]|nr:hypothetical protein SUGI_1062070 [Cryptomeria japonica]